MISGTVAIDITSKSMVKHTAKRLSRQGIIEATLLRWKPND
jgi:hypothetical protein